MKKILKSTEAHTKLKERRLQLGMTQKQLSEKSGVYQSTISFFETGERTGIRFEDYFKLLDALNIEVTFKFIDE